MACRSPARATSRPVPVLVGRRDLPRPGRRADRRLPPRRGHLPGLPHPARRGQRRRPPRLAGTRPGCLPALARLRLRHRRPHRRRHGRPRQPGRGDRGRGYPDRRLRPARLGVHDRNPSPACRGSTSPAILDNAQGDPVSRLRGRRRPRGGSRHACPAFSFGGCRLGQQCPGELPRLGHREACPSACLAAGALPEVHEDPGNRAPGIAESEPADRKFPPAACAQAVAPSVSAGTCGLAWPGLAS
jgi:hypothetical protein